MLFTQSTYLDANILRNTRLIEGTGNRLLEPGESLDARVEVPGRCGMERFWRIYASLGPSREGEMIEIRRRTADEAERTIDLGDTSCWTFAPVGNGIRYDDAKVVEYENRAVGCDASTTRYGLAPEEEDGNGAVGEGADDSVAGGEEAVDLGSLQGDWRRLDSNNPRNDGMRVSLAGGQGRLTYLPPTGSRKHAVGQIQWRGLGTDGTLEVRGSDGGYYTAKLRMDGPDRFHIDIDANGAGNDQTWERAGPSIEGDWELVDSTDGGWDGTRISVADGRAEVRYLPASAPRGVRVGSALWDGVGSDGTVSVTMASGRTESGRATLPSDDVLRIVVDGSEGQVVQVWLRPGTDEEAAEGLIETAVVEPGTAGADEQAAPDDLPEVDVPENLPPPAPAESEARACVDTSLSHDAAFTPWGWGLTAESEGPLPDEVKALVNSTLPDVPHIDPAPQMVTDIERSSVELPGVDDHFSYIWQKNPDYRGWRAHDDLTSTAYHEKWKEYEEMGWRPADVEAYQTDEGLRFAGVWVANVEDVDTWSRRNMTTSEYDEAYEMRRDAGYRMIDFEAYPTANGVRYATIWYRSCAPDDWTARRDLTRQEYDQTLDVLSPQGFFVVDFESYRTDGGQRYAAIFERGAAGRAWQMRSDRDYKQFLNLHHRYVDQGFRLIDYEAYETEDGVRYAGVWLENGDLHDYAHRAQLDGLIEAYRTRNDLPAISVAVIDHGKLVYRRGFGDADRHDGKWAHAETVYPIASVSKVVGAVLAARLQEQGVVDLDALSRDLPMAPPGTLVEVNGVPMLDPQLPQRHLHTPEQLMAKTGCMWHYPEGPEPASGHYRWRVEGLVQIWNADLLLGCLPGKQYHYSTHGFSIVGAVLEGATGTPIARLIEDEIAGPFGLNSLRAMYTEDGLPANYDRATPYRLVYRSKTADATTNPSIETGYDDNSWKVLGGGLEVNAVDLARFGWKTLNTEIVSDTAYLWRSRTSGATIWGSGKRAPPVGLGWNVSKNRARHNGSWEGVGTELLLDRKEEIVVAILTNRRHGSQTDLYKLPGKIAAIVD
ncbi:MAG: serine hydrolase [Gemmatimonadales bacterium]